MAEYRVEELAAETGSTVRSVQSYRTLGLLPPPERRGRVAVYSSEHVVRVRLITDLVRRGYSLNAVAELFDGLDRGDRIQDLLGIDRVLGRPEPLPTEIPGAAVGELLGDASSIADAVRLGVLEPVGTQDDLPPVERSYRVLLPENLRAATALVAAGIPPIALLQVGIAVRRDADAIAERFVALVTEHAIDDGSVTETAHADSITELAERLVPLAEAATLELLRDALAGHVRLEVDRQIGRLLGAAHDRAADGEERAG